MADPELKDELAPFAKDVDEQTAFYANLGLAALKDKPAEEFKAPTEAKFAMIRGIREAFRPGTEPTSLSAPLGAAGVPSGPQPYSTVFQNGITGAPSAAAAVAPPAAPAAKKKDDLSDLF